MASESQDNKRRMIQVRANNALLQHSLETRLADLSRRVQDRLSRYEDEKRELRQELARVRRTTMDVDSLLQKGLNDPVTKKQKQTIATEISRRQQVNKTKYMIARANLARELRHTDPSRSRSRRATSSGNPETAKQGAQLAEVASQQNTVTDSL